MNYLGKDILSNFRHKPSDDQFKAVKSLSSLLEDTDLERPTFLLTGYAGSGKTTLISALVKSLNSRNIKYELLAPTGRAAKVITSYCKEQANTIHRHIYKNDQSSLSITFQAKKNTEKSTVYIVDEASMINDMDEGKRNLLVDLVKFVFTPKGNNTLILIGDTAQLPPVGQALSPALNIETLKLVHKLDVVRSELTSVHRQQQHSGILDNATMLRSNLVNAKYQLEFTTSGYKDLFKLPTNRFKDCIKYAYQKFSTANSIIITRSNKRAVELNNFIRKQIKGYTDEIVEGEILMAVKNCYNIFENEDHFLANGDFMEVVKVGEKVRKYGFNFMKVTLKLDCGDHTERFDTWIVMECLTSASSGLSYEQVKTLRDNIIEFYSGKDVDQNSIDDLVRNDPFFNAVHVKYAYAITAHKSQGGQFDCVVIDYPYCSTIDVDYMRWMYTAVTRSVKELYLLNFPSTFFTPVLV